MPRLTCPECDAGIPFEGVASARQEARCPECEHAFLPDDDDDEQEDAPKKKKRADDDDAEPTKKKGKKSGKKKKQQSSSVMLFALLGGGALVLVLTLAVGGVLYFVFGRTGGGGGGGNVAVKDGGKLDGGKADGGPKRDDGGGGGIFGKTPTVNKATYNKLEHGLTYDEVDAILAPGKKVTSQDAIKFVLNIDSFDGLSAAPLSHVPNAKYVLYVEGNKQLLVGFVPTKKYGDVSGYHGIWDPGTKWGSSHHAPTTWPRRRARTSSNVAPIARRAEVLCRSEVEKGAGDSHLLRRLLERDGEEYDFKKDGTLVYYYYSDKDRKQWSFKGNYRFIDDTTAELSHGSIGPKARKPTSSYKVYVSTTELNLAELTPLGDYIKGETFQRQKK